MDTCQRRCNRIVQGQSVVWKEELFPLTLGSYIASYLDLLLSARAKPISVKWNSGRAVHRQEPFITHHQHSSHFTNVNRLRHRLRHRILSIPDGYCLFRTDIISSGRVLFIPSGCWTSEAFQVYLYSYAVPQQ